MTEQKMQEMLGLAGAMASTPNGAPWKLSCEDARELGRMLLATFSALGDAGVKLEDLQAQLEEKSCGLLRANENLSAKLDDVCKERDSLRVEVERFRKQYDIARDERNELFKIRDAVCVERDSLKNELHFLRIGAQRVNGGIEELTKEGNSLRDDLIQVAGERDSLQVELKRVICARDHNRECIARLIEERAVLRKELDELNSASNQVILERDALRELSKKPLFQFAIELDRMNQQAAKALGGGVA